LALGRPQINKPRPIKVVFNPISDAFDILKNKSNPSTDHPTISVSSDRTQNERDYMLKLHVQLTMHSSKGEVGLVINPNNYYNKSEFVNNSSHNKKLFFLIYTLFTKILEVLELN